MLSRSCLSRVLNISSTVGPERSGGGAQGGGDPKSRAGTPARSPRSCNPAGAFLCPLPALPCPFLEGEAASRRGQGFVLGGFRGPHDVPRGPLTDGAGGRDDGSFRQDLHDARPHRGRAAAVGVQVAQELLDNQVGVLRLGGGRRAGPKPQPPRGLCARAALDWDATAGVDEGEVLRPVGTGGGVHVSSVPSPWSHRSRSPIPGTTLISSCPGPFHFKRVKSQFFGLSFHCSWVPGHTGKDHHRPPALVPCCTKCSLITLGQ